MSSTENKSYLINNVAQKPNEVWPNGLLGWMLLGSFIFFIYLNEIINFSYGLILSIVISLITFLAIGTLIHKIVYTYQMIVYNRLKCEHDIIGGITNSKCSQCVEYLRQRKLIEKREIELKRQSNLLIQEEQKRLSKLLLNDLENIQKLNPNKFEHFVGDIYNKKGFSVKITKATNDGGYDGVLTKNGIVKLLECKCYNSSNGVGRPAIQKFHSAILDYEASGGIFVTTSFFHNTAIEYAKGKNIQLVDGKNLISNLNIDSIDSSPVYYDQLCRVCGERIKIALSNTDTVYCKNDHEVEPEISLRNIHQEWGYYGLPRYCKRDGCNGKLKRRKGKRGAFWGCSNYPKCRYTTN